MNSIKFNQTSTGSKVKFQNHVRIIVICDVIMYIRWQDFLSIVCDICLQPIFIREFHIRKLRHVPKHYKYRRIKGVINKSKRKKERKRKLYIQFLFLF